MISPAVIAQIIAANKIQQASSSGGGGANLTVVSVDPQAVLGPSNIVHTLTGVPAGAMLVLTLASEDDSAASSANATLSDTVSLVWSRQSNVIVPNSGKTQIWITVFTAGGSINITTNFSGATSKYYSSTCYVITGQEPAIAGSQASASLESTPSVNITTTKANSIIVNVVSDWNAISGSVTYNSLPVVPVLTTWQSTRYTSYHWYKVASTPTSYTMGMSSYPGGSTGISISSYEIRIP